jgi:hypothetical protein
MWGVSAKSTAFEAVMRVALPPTVCDYACTLNVVEARCLLCGVEGFCLRELEVEMPRRVLDSFIPTTLPSALRIISVVMVLVFLSSLPVVFWRLGYLFQWNR